MVIASAAQTGRAIAAAEAAGLTGLGPIADAGFRIGIADRGPRRGGIGAAAGAVHIGRAGLCGGEADAAEARKARRGASRARLAVGKRFARSVEAARSPVRRTVRGARASVSARVPGPAGAAPLAGSSGSQTTARGVPSEATWPERLGAAARGENDRCSQEQERHLAHPRTGSNIRTGPPRRGGCGFAGRESQKSDALSDAAAVPPGPALRCRVAVRKAQKLELALGLARRARLDSSP